MNCDSTRLPKSRVPIYRLYYLTFFFFSAPSYTVPELCITLYGFLISKRINNVPRTYNKSCWPDKSLRHAKIIIDRKSNFRVDIRISIMYGVIKNVLGTQRQKNEIPNTHYNAYTGYCLKLFEQRICYIEYRYL